MKRQAQASHSDNPLECRVSAGLWLRELREAIGLSQRELADRIGLPYYTFISQIESGKGRVPAERYAAWADALEKEPRSFAMRMLGFYEPTTYTLIFDQPS